MHTLAFALKWDPQIHGLLVVLLAIVLVISLAARFATRSRFGLGGD